jgi:hypothetical protein
MRSQLLRLSTVPHSRLLKKYPWNPFFEPLPAAGRCAIRERKVFFQSPLLKPLTT